MARMITIRTLAGYSKNNVHAIYLTKLVEERMKDLDRLSKKLTNPDTWNIGGDRMKFDAVVGNPPYQLTKNGNNEQIHFAFLELAYKTTAHYVSLIQPLNCSIMGNCSIKLSITLFHYSGIRIVRVCS